MQPRDYQTLAANTAICNNSIVNIRTGGGKTLIAVLVVDHFLKARIEKRIMFIVPSRALVSQQAKYVREHSTIPGLRVAEMCGNELGAWTRLQWEAATRDYAVFVGTAEVFRMALVDQGFIQPKDFSLVVIDECHNAVGNHPMAAVLRDSIQRAAETERPRILGLTASFVNGSMSNIMKKRELLEELFNGNLICPEVTEDTSTTKDYSKIYVPVQDLNCFEFCVKAVIESVLAPVASDLPDFDKWVTRGFNVFVELGFVGLRFWLKEGIVTQLRAHCDEMKSRSHDTICLRKASKLERSFPTISDILRHATVSISVASSSLPPVPAYSKKLACLLGLLSSLIGNDESKRKSTSRGIIFVEQVSLTYPLAAIVNRYFMFASKSESSRGLTSLESIMGTEDFRSEEILADTVRPVSGANSMRDKVREANLALFRSGSVPLLVSTNALEEGIDVPECEFVIRFDSFSTTKSHIQGSGRARCKAAKIYYFENDPYEECAKAAEMEAVGRNKDLNLSAGKLNETLVEMQRQSTVGYHTPVQYPFRHPSSPTHTSTSSISTSSVKVESVLDGDDTSGEVNFFNCLQIFYKYVQKVLKQSFDPSALFEWQVEVVRSYPFEERDVLVSITYPSLTGYECITNEEIDSFWRGYTIEEVVLPKERYSKMSETDREKRRGVYVLVVTKLHGHGLLTPSNEASATALSSVSQICSVLPLPRKLNLKNQFPSELLTSSKTCEPPPVTSTTTTQGDPITADYKSGLQMLLQKTNPHSQPHTLINYETTLLKNGLFQSVVSIKDSRYVANKASGLAYKKKKDAEQSAAKKFLEQV